MNKFELESLQQIIDFSREVENAKDKWDVRSCFERYLEAEESLKVNNADFSNEARVFFNKALEDTFESFKIKAYAINHPLEDEKEPKEEGPF